MLVLPVGLLAALACAREEPAEPFAAQIPHPTADDVPFDSTMELLEAVEERTFAERAGSLEALERRAAAQAEPEVSVPAPVKVAFVSGTRVPDDARDALRELAARLEAEPRLAVDLVGCSDPSGSREVNLRISQARAEAVAAELEALGARTSQIREVVGRGEGCEVQERAVHVTPALGSGG
jgi:outer membrane protein OmpA-like peptidoglycan-associated protein